MEFLFQNPLILLAIVLIVMAGLAKVIIKPRKKKTAETKVSKVKDSNKITETTGEPDTNIGAPVSESEEIKEEKKKRKLKKLKPEITKVYEKKKLKSKEETEEKKEDLSQIEEEFLKRMQFVKTSKTVSRLKPYTEEEMMQQIQQEQISELTMAEEECPICKEEHKSSYFDKSRRLSKMIQDGSFDDMFCSHISEKYMNMDEISRHIRNCDEIEEKLFERTARTMANSESKVSVTEDNKINQLKDKDSMKAWLEERRRQELAKYVKSNNEDVGTGDSFDYEDLIQDDVDLSARNVLVVDSILNRKGKKGSRK